MRHQLNGILIVDKPANMTSAKVVAHVKKLLGAGKAGHAGTLDPLATGVLVCCLNDATKLCRFLLHSKKNTWRLFILELKQIRRILQEI